jgi:hypothetical protein
MLLSLSPLEVIFEQAGEVIEPIEPVDPIDPVDPVKLFAAKKSIDPVDPVKLFAPKKSIIYLRPHHQLTLLCLDAPKFR